MGSLNSFTGSSVHRFIASLLHSCSCAAILSCHFIGISTTVCSFADAPHNFNTFRLFLTRLCIVGLGLGHSSALFWCHQEDARQREALSPPRGTASPALEYRVPQQKRKCSPKRPTPVPPWGSASCLAVSIFGIQKNYFTCQPRLFFPCLLFSVPSFLSFLSCCSFQAVLLSFPVLSFLLSIESLVWFYSHKPPRRRRRMQKFLAARVLAAWEEKARTGRQRN